MDLTRLFNSQNVAVDVTHVSFPSLHLFKILLQRYWCLILRHNLEGEESAFRPMYIVQIVVWLYKKPCAKNKLRLKKH